MNFRDLEEGDTVYLVAKVLHKEFVAEGQDEEDQEALEVSEDPGDWNLYLQIGNEEDLIDFSGDELERTMFKSLQDLVESRKHELLGEISSEQEQHSRNIERLKKELDNLGQVDKITSAE